MSPTTSAVDLTTIIVALVASVPSIIAVVINRKKTGADLQVIHSLVNSRLSAALNEIAELRDFIDSRIREGERSTDMVPPSHDAPSSTRKPEQP